MRTKRLVLLPFAVPLFLIGYIYISSGPVLATVIGGVLLAGGFILIAVAMS